MGEWHPDNFDSPFVVYGFSSVAVPEPASALLPLSVFLVNVGMVVVHRRTVVGSPK
jgi:hypothetical protein